jgi:hypothetical protein
LRVSKGSMVLGDIRLAVVVAVAVGLWIPYVRLEWFSGHEQYAYVLRTIEWAAELRAGELYPRWCPDFYGGYGSPFFIFYAPVVYAISGFLTATGLLDPFSALKVVILLASLASGVGTYALIFGETRQRDAAMVGALAYLAAPYRLGDIFDRGDICEFACIAFLPVAIALYRAAAMEQRPLRARLLAVAAAATHAIVIMTHTILGLWSTIAIGFIVAATAIGLASRGLRQRALLQIAAVACGPGLAAIYLVPAVTYRTITRTAAMTVNFYNPLNHWMPVSTLFAKSISLFLRNFLQMGPLIVTSAIVVAIGLIVNVRRGRFALGWMALCLGLLFLTMAPGSGFWAAHRIPLATFIQFPWRLLGPIGLFASVALGVGAAAAFERIVEPARGAIAVAGGAALLLAIAWPFVSTKEMAYEGIPRDGKSIQRRMDSATDGDDYLPSIADRPNASRESVVAETAGATIDLVSSDGSHHDILLRAQQNNATVRLALHGFPGWSVRTVSGPAQARLESDSKGLLVLEVPIPGNYQLKVWFGSSAASRIGLMLTMLSAVALFLIALRGTRFWQAPFTTETAGATR